MKNRIISLSVSINKIILLSVILISGIILFLSRDSDIILHIVSIFLISISASFLVEFDFFHPYCWFSLFYSLYACGYSIMYLLGAVTKYGYSKETMVYQWIGLVTLLIVLPAKRCTTFINLKREKGNRKIISAVLNIILLYLVLALFMIMTGGYSNKTDIYENGNFLVEFAFALAYFAILLYVYELYDTLVNAEQIRMWNIIKPVIIIMLFGFISGERDYIFTIVMLTVMILFLFGKIKRGILFACIPIGVIVLPLSNVFKYYILTQKLSTNFTINNLVIEFFDGEFISAGRNLQILINNNCENYFGGKSVLNDLLRVFISTGYSNQSWFNESFFPTVHSTQYGFTLVGEGYVNGGIIGIILIYAFVGCLLRFLYITASKNQYRMIIYLYMMPLFVYATRADLANILSPLLKYAILGTCLIAIMNKGVLGKERRL